MNYFVGWKLLLFVSSVARGRFAICSVGVGRPCCSVECVCLTPQLYDGMSTLRQSPQKTLPPFPPIYMHYGKSIFGKTRWNLHSSRAAGQMLKFSQNAKIISIRFESDPQNSPQGAKIGWNRLKRWKPHSPRAAERLTFEGKLISKNMPLQAPSLLRLLITGLNPCRAYWFGCLSWIYEAKALKINTLKKSLFSAERPKLALLSNSRPCRASKLDLGLSIELCSTGFRLCSTTLERVEWGSNGVKMGFKWGHFGGLYGVNIGVYMGSI